MRTLYKLLSQLNEGPPRGGLLAEALYRSQQRHDELMAEALGRDDAAPEDDDTPEGSGPRTRATGREGPAAEPAEPAEPAEEEPARTGGSAGPRSFPSQW